MENKQINIPLPINAHQKAFEMKTTGKVSHRDIALVEMIEKAMPHSKAIQRFEPSSEIRKNTIVFVPMDLHQRVMELCGKKSAYSRGKFPMKHAYEFLLTKGAELV
jgi:hypothetical protein